MSQQTEEGIRVKVALTNIAMPFTITSTSTVTVPVSDIEATYIAVNPTTPQYNNPSTYANTLFVWPGGPAVPFGQPAFASAAAKGQIISGNFDAEEWVVGYSVGPAVTTGSGSSAVTTYPNVCATAAIPANWNLNNAVYFSPGLGINSVQTNVISFSYRLPAGVNPSANGAWIGLWPGNVNPYTTSLVPLGAWAAISATTDSGSAPMGGLNFLTPNGSYTAALYTSGYSATATGLTQTTVATSIQFTLSAATT